MSLHSTEDNPDLNDSWDFSKKEEQWNDGYLFPHELYKSNLLIKKNVFNAISYSRQ